MSLCNIAPKEIWVRSTGNGDGGLYSTTDRSESGPCQKYIKAEDYEVMREKHREEFVKELLDAEISCLWGSFWVPIKQKPVAGQSYLIWANHNGIETYDVAFYEGKRPDGGDWWILGDINFQTSAIKAWAHISGLPDAMAAAKEERELAKRRKMALEEFLISFAASCLLVGDGIHTEATQVIEYLTKSLEKIASED